MDNELNNTVQPEPAPISGTEGADGLEVAHVLFMDLVAFSIWPMEEQREGLRELQGIVRSTSQVRRGEHDRNPVRLPTGDGIVLVFFGDPIACVQCALEISAKLKSSSLKLRMGINTGPVYRVADINTNLNAAGGGINMAQRIMDAADPGHILVSKSTAEILLQLKEWAAYLHDLGEHRVKHGVKVQFYNLYTSELGNPALPSIFHAEHRQLIKRTRTRWMMVVVVALLVVLGGVFLASRIIAGKRRLSVAVMGFRNITSRHEADWVSTGLAEGLRTQLASTGKIRTISGQECAEIWRDLGLTELNSMARSTLNRVHDRGADLVIIGSYTAMPDGRIHMNLEIQDTAQGETIDSIAADGTELEVAQLIAQTGEQVRSKMGLGTISPEKERQLALSQPSPSAAPYYSDGLAKLRSYEPLQARGFLERAVMMDPAFPFAHSVLGEAWLLLGYDQRARAEAKKAFELANKLSFEDRTSIEARYRGITSDWPAAVATYQQLYDYSQNLDYGLKLAEVQRSAGKGQSALLTLASLRKLPKPEGEDPRIDLEEAETSASLGDLKRGLTVAARAAEVAKDRGARLLESRSLIWSCVAHRRLGEIEKGKQACEQARKIATDLDDKLGAARAVNNLANFARDEGDLDRATKLFEQALSYGRDIGSQRDVAGALNNLGLVLQTRGDLSAASQRYEEALKIEQEIGFKSEIPRTLGNQGLLFHQLGDFAAAQRAYERAIAVAQETGNKRSLATSNVNLGVLLFERGDLSGAEKRYEQAIGIQKGVGAKSQMANTLDSLAELSLVRNNLTDAEQKFREAATIQQSLGEKGAAAVSKAGLAKVLIEKNQPQLAEAEARAAVAELHAENSREDEVSARLALARSLLAQKKVPEAEQEVRATRQLANASSSRSQQYELAIVAAQLDASTPGRRSKAVEPLRRVQWESKKAGLLGFELESRLAIAEISASQGSGPWQSELKSIQKVASESGYLLLASKASQLSR